MRAVVERLAALSPRARLGLALGMVLLTAALDALPGVAISFLPLYALAVAYAAWFLPLRSALAVAGVSAALALWSDLQPPEPSHAALDGLLRLFAFLALQAGLTGLRSTLDHARSDEITGVADRGAFLIAAVAELRRARRYRRPLTLLCLDIDGFRALNERIGRYAGDAVLRSAAQGLKRMLRASDMVARISDDGFAVLLPETGFSGAAGVVEKLRSQLPHTLERGSISPSFCTGVVSWATAPDSVELLFGASERALARARAKGPGSLEHEVMTQHPAPAPDARLAR